MTVTDLSVFYGDHQALDKVSMEFSAGLVTALIGPSGCGKTSLLTCLNRLVQMVPTSRVTGQCFMDEFDVMSPTTDIISLRRQVGMIFQKPNPFALSISRNIELPLISQGIKRHRRHEIVEEVLRDVGLWDEVKDRLHRSALTLSGGQQQRLCIARALALKPRVLLMDEPCSALDPIAAGRVEELIRKLRSCYTLVVVTHNMAQAQRIADHVGVFWASDEGRGGQLIETGPCEQIFEQPRHKLTAAYVQGRQG